MKTVKMALAALVLFGALGAAAYAADCCATAEACCKGGACCRTSQAR